MQIVACSLLVFGQQVCGEPVAEEVGLLLLGIASTCLTQEQTPKKKVSEQFASLPAVLVESRESAE